MVWFIGLILTIVRGLLRLGWYISIMVKLFFNAYEYTALRLLYIRESIMYFIGLFFAKFFKSIKVGLFRAVASKGAIN